MVRSRSRFGYRNQPIPVTGRMLRWLNAGVSQTNAVSFKDGINNYSDNDEVKPTQLVQVTDGRMVKIGRYRTRQGSDHYSVPIGEASNVAVVSVAGASTVGVSSTNYIGQAVVATATGRATRLDLKIKSQTGTAGPIIIELHSSLDVLASSLLARTSIASSAITTIAATLPAYFMEAPLLTNGVTYYVIIKGQTDNTGTYLVSTTTAATTLSTSTNSGLTWASTSTAANLTLYTATDGGVKGLTRVYRVGGQKQTLFAHGSSVYSINDADGTTTAVKTGLNASATNYRFALAQDTLYWVNGLEKPYKYDFSTVTQVTNSPYTPSLIMEHKGIMFYVDAADKTRLFYTNFALYDTFTSTDFINVPAPKSYDSLTALAKLNGVLFLFANRNKYTLFGSDNATFRLDQAIGTKGTYTQETVVQDLNNIYFASDDGIYRFNGTQETNIALSVLDWYMALTNKAGMTFELYNNHLYVYYTPSGSADNINCRVFNTLLDIWESDDTNTMIARTVARQTADNVFVQGSNRAGAIYWGELSSNDYHNLGNIMNFEVRTNYSHFGSPGEMKRIPKWRPKFTGQVGAYNGQAGYAVDMIDAENYSNVAMGTNAPRTDTGLLTDNGVLVGGITLIEPTTLQIPGTAKRIQRRYRHIAAHEPIELDEEILEIQTQRLV